MAYYIPHIGSSLSKYLYKTEYQRSFLDNIERSESRSKTLPSLNYKDMDINNYQNQFARQKYVSEEKTTPSQCSIAVQTDEKKVKFDLTPRNIDNRDKNLDKTRNQHKENKQTFDEKCFQQPVGINRDVTTSYSYEEKEPTTPMENNYVSSQERTFTPYCLNLVAGNDSGNYQRAPFIQKKKKVTAPISNLPNEPALQKKKIIPYFKNHNILRTSTVPAENYVITDNHNVYSHHLKHVPQDMYKSSYEREFTHYPIAVSPLISADVRLSGYRDWPARNRNDIKNSLSYSAGAYDKSNYQSEYNCQFSPKTSKENLAAANNDKQFSEYYQQVLNKRQVAYKPFLAWQDHNERDSVRKNNKTNNGNDDDKQPRKDEAKDSVTTLQTFRNGRYTRTYNPEIYT